MNYVKQCPHCGGEVIEKSVLEVLRGGMNTAFLTVQAGVCRHCGERLFTPATVQQFERIEAKLEQQQTEEFQLVGRAFQAAA
jgi:YgiT-type zinc finger domain-containing protein